MTGNFTVVTIEEHVPIPERDRIVSSFVAGRIVIIGKEDTPVGTRGLLFDCETQFNPELLYELSLFRDSALNKNQAHTGYFKDNRVRPQIFAGVKCDGFFLSFEQLEEVSFLQGISVLKDGYCENNFKNTGICKKWSPTSREGTPRNLDKKKKLKKKSKIVEGQFNFHKSTTHLGNAYGHIKPTTKISLSHKLHGTSFVAANLLCYKKVGWFRKLINLGRYKPTHYQNIYSSRQVIKNDKDSSQKVHYYSVDVWGAVNELIKDKIKEGITLYGEITGYLPGSQKMIQKHYDYGSKEGEFQYWIYRITFTQPNGLVQDFSTAEIIDYCRTNKLRMVPYIFDGTASDFFDSPSEHYGKNLFGYLTEQYLEKDCIFCKSKVPGEGVVLRIEDDPHRWAAFKLKSFRFTMIESKAQEADIETEN